MNFLSFVSKLHPNQESLYDVWMEISKALDGFLQQVIHMPLSVLVPKVILFLFIVSGIIVAIYFLGAIITGIEEGVRKAREESKKNKRAT